MIDLRLWICLAFVCGCSPGWSDADTKSATDAIHAELMVESICSDGGDCKPAQVRALERAVLCANSAMLFRHGAAVPDPRGIKCQP